MLEIVFDDSVKEAMKQAKVYNEKDWEDSAYSYIGKRPTKEELREEHRGKAIGGNLEDVVSIGYSLDIGDISEDIDSKGRKKVFDNIYSYVNFSEKEREDFFYSQRKDLGKLISVAKEGGPIRIWKGNAPFSVCGFAFVCNLLKDIDCEINIVSLPEYLEIDNDRLIYYDTWRSVAPGEFYKFLSYQDKLSNIRRIVYADLWDDLKKENSPLRAIVNGKLISVPEDFYDHIIVDNIPDGEFRLGSLIGNILGKYGLGVNDTWYFSRIVKMIEDNKLKVIEDKDSFHPYDRILRKS